MNAIVPLNIAALRVSNNDATNVVGNFQGKTATFEQLPWFNPNVQPPPKLASTGDKVYATLAESNGQPLNSPVNPLGVGVHLHWELPNYFKKGVQDPDTSALVFPAAPNRWLVTRFLSFLDTKTNTYGAITTKSWVVESDFLSPTLTVGGDSIVRPRISVPIPSAPEFREQPYMYMGRVVDYASWNPASTPASNYLPSYKGNDGKPLYLTSVGFVGAYFGSYYPECCSVFGFWDNFSDVSYGTSSLYQALQQNTAVQFRASYQVCGWLNEQSADPFSNLDAVITQEYNEYLQTCNNAGVAPTLTPNDFFKKITSDNMKWTFNMDDVGFTLNSDNTIKSLNYPERTLCGGTAQEVVWNMASNPGTTYFLNSNNALNPAVWNSPVSVAVGNSTEEVVSAMLKNDLQGTVSDTQLLENYEYLLDAEQLGLLPELESNPNKLIELEEALHSNAFGQLSGGYLWIVGTKHLDPTQVPTPDEEVTLPLPLAEQLALLNQAQKAYDLGRQELATLRNQLYMDWTYYVKLYTGEINSTPGPLNIPLNNISLFLTKSGGSELSEVVAKGAAVGMASFITDPVSGAVTGMNPPLSGTTGSSLALTLYRQYQTVVNAVIPFANEFQLECTKAPSFFMPNEPVVLMEGPMMAPVNRNGSGNTFVRLSPEILSSINVTYNGGQTLTVSVANLQGVPTATSVTPMAADVQSLLGETFLITPMLAATVAKALAAQGGTGNPAVANLQQFTTSLMYGQGGLSPLDVLPSLGGVPAPPSLSLFNTVRSDNYTPVPNLCIEVAAPQILELTFTNASNNGFVTSAVGWNTQTALTSFSSTRVDPFIPIFMIWNVQINPLKWESQDDNGNPIYSPTNLTDFFQLDADAVDWQYKLENGQGVDFTAAEVGYGNSSTMSSNATNVLVYQIASYLNANPDDPEKQTLEEIAAYYGSRNFLSQSISGFNVQQVLRTPVAQIAVENLTFGPRDAVTNAIANAAVTNSWDNWYTQAFTGFQPISTNLQAQLNFGPLRSGFMEIQSIELVDAFGQRMDLQTATRMPDGSLSVTTSYSMTPPASDTGNKGKIYLAPRVLTPSRLWFQWLSASFDPTVPGITGDFEEMGAHPATSPVCGWVLPNHLDDNLFFYDANGIPIGTFGIEHQATNPTLVYRTRAGNLNNPTNDLAKDIGAKGHPLVNENLANYMWYLSAQDAAYLKAMMLALQDSAGFINPANYAQNTSLSVLIGRPLALTRVVAGLETAGNLLPISQANTSKNAPLPQDVNNMRYKYADRMANSSANLGNVSFPLRLGDLANLDDGLVGYILEGPPDSNGSPYANSAVFYAPAATDGISTKVQAPTETNLQLTLNAKPIHLTLLVDPRAAVHATTGILPVNELSIPTDQYAAAMNSLAVNFTTRPILQMANDFIVPLPSATGFAWTWVPPGNSPQVPLLADAANETPIYGYSPQQLLEGWVQLNPTNQKKS